MNYLHNQQKSVRSEIKIRRFGIFGCLETVAVIAQSIMWSPEFWPADTVGISLSIRHTHTKHLSLWSNINQSVESLIKSGYGTCAAYL